MHFRLHDIHRAGAAVLAGGVAVEVVHRRQVGDQAVEDALWYFVAVFVENGVDGHQVTNVTHKQQRTTVQAQRATLRRAVLAVRVHGAGEALATFADAFRQVAFHQAEPVAVDHHFVVGIDCSDGVFAVHDGGQGGFDQDVFYTRCVGLADRGVGVDLDLEVQAVVLEQDGGRFRRIALEANQLCIIAQATFAATLEGDYQFSVFDTVGGGVDMGAGCQWRGLIEEGASEGNDLVATNLVVAFAFFRATRFADGVGAIQGVVQRAPAGVGCVQGKARIHDRNHQLWAGHASDFVIDVFGGNLEICRFWQQVADFLKEGFVGRSIVCLAFACLVPGVDLRLQVVTFGQEGFVLWSEVVDDLFRTHPELFGVDTGSRNGFVVHEVEQDFGDLKATDLNVFSHCLPHSAQLFSSSI